MKAESESAKFTPGPWGVMKQVKIFNDCDVIISEHVEDAIVCSMGHDMPEVEANARLIAASPTMYEALRSLVAKVRPCEHTGCGGNRADACDWCNARAALRAAEGA